MRFSQALSLLGAGLSLPCAASAQDFENTPIGASPSLSFKNTTTFPSSTGSSPRPILSGVIPSSSTDLSASTPLAPSGTPPSSASLSSGGPTSSATSADISSTAPLNTPSDVISLSIISSTSGGPGTSSDSTSLSETIVSSSNTPVISVPTNSSVISDVSSTKQSSGVSSSDLTSVKSSSTLTSDSVSTSGSSTSEPPISSQTSEPISSTTDSSDTPSDGISTTTSILVTTITEPPPEFTTEHVTRSEWTSNTWLTTTDQSGTETILPVLVGCEQCGGGEDDDGDDGAGIILWGVPAVSGAVISFPGLPPFSLPCIPTILTPCSNPPRNEGNGDDTGSSRTTASQITSTSSCTLSVTVSDCRVTCKITTEANSSPTGDCFTTECSGTTAGCDVTGATSTITQTECPLPTGTDIARRDDCEIKCPTWPDVKIPEIDDLPSSDQEDAEIVERGILPLLGRFLYPRAEKKNVKAIGGCAVDTAWPAGSPAATPSYPGGLTFFNEDKANFGNEKNPAKKAASEAVPRWYTTTTVGCTPTVTTIAHAQYTVIQKDWEPHRASLDHAWEKSWLTEFFGSMIDGTAAELDKVTDKGDGKITCDDFKKYVFGAKPTGQGTKNLIRDVYRSIASSQNLDFVGMTQFVNDRIKGIIWDYESKLDNPLTKLKSEDVSQGTANEALEAFDRKLELLGRVRMSVAINNEPDIQNIMRVTNDRIHAEISNMDNSLKASHKTVAPLANGFFFTRAYEQYMEDMLHHPSKGVVGKVKASAQDLIKHINLEFSKLQSRQGDLAAANLGAEWANTQAQWALYSALPSSTWDLVINWQWKCRAPTKRRRQEAGDEAENEDFGSCELPPPDISTTTSAPTSAPTSELATTTLITSSRDSTSSAPQNESTSLSVSTTHIVTISTIETVTPTPAEPSHSSTIITTSSAFEEPPTTSPPDDQPEQGLHCFGVDTGTFIGRDDMNDKLGKFCVEAAAQRVQDKDSGSIVRKYNSGTRFEVDISMDWPSGRDISNNMEQICKDKMTTIMDSCDGNNPKNPLNWKHGGTLSDGPVRYGIYPKIDQGYRPGSCSFHLQEDVEWVGMDGPGTRRRWWFAVEKLKMFDDAKNEIGRAGFKKDSGDGQAIECGDRNPFRWETKLPDVLEITPEAVNDYIQFTIGSRSWTTGDSSCTVGGYSGQYSPVDRNMDCSFSC